MLALLDLLRDDDDDDDDDGGDSVRLALTNVKPPLLEPEYERLSVDCIAFTSSFTEHTGLAASLRDSPAAAAADVMSSR